MTYNALTCRLARRGLFRIHPGLERIQSVLAWLGNPHDAVKSIHVAGTNGKGSVAAGLESVLRHAGFRTGLYTSPHLWDLRERIQINRCPLGINAFGKTAQVIFAAERRAGLSLTYFEFLTVMAFVHFAREAVDVMIIETGMGGRWDATNVIQQPALTVITSVGLDHTQWLGRTESAIAREKAGIIKQGVPVISGARGPAGRVVARYAHAGRSPLRQIDSDFTAEGESVDWRRAFQTIRYAGWASGERVIDFGLLGCHQVDNAALILAGVDELNLQGWKIAPSAIETGLAQVSWPGRFQLLPSDSGPTVLFDGAHNPPAIQRLLETLNSSPWQGTPKLFIFGVYRDKDYRRMVSLIQPHAGRILACTLPGPRSLPAKKIAAALGKNNSSIHIVRDPRKALQLALQSSGKKDLIVVTGSLALVGMLLHDGTLNRTPHSRFARTLPLKRGEVNNCDQVLCLDP